MTVRMDAPPATPLVPARLGPIRRTVREVGLGLITAGFIILLFVAYQLFGTGVTESHNQARLQSSFNQALRAHGQAAPPSGPSASVPPVTVGTGATDVPTVGAAPNISTPAGGAIDHLVIPKIGVDKFVVDGTGEEDLARGPGHYAGTVYPGQVGNAAIAGHRTTYGAPFYRLDELSVGDDIYFTDTTGAKFRYQVDQSLVVSPSDVAVIGPTPDAELTLTTCTPRFSAASRLVVKAKLVGLPVPTPVTVPAVTSQPAPPHLVPTPRPANLTAGNNTAWPPALGYGAAVVALWIGTRLAINRSRRWRRAGSYAGGIGLCAVPLWFCFENVVRLLPQSI